jgi:dephospho-CoA kinase
VRRIALAGGIGAGKSTAQAHLERRGFFVIDADATARDVVKVGRPAYVALRDAFGDGILASDGSLDRTFLAEVVFHDPSALARLNAITHPRIGEEILEQLTRAQEAGERAVFVALPLFRSEHREIFGLDSAWSIEVDPALAEERLVRRGLTLDDAKARLAAQMGNDERRALCDHVIVNDTTVLDLQARLDELIESEGLSRG